VISPSRSFKVLVNQMIIWDFSSADMVIVVLFGSLPRVSTKSCGGLMSATVMFDLIPSFLAKGVSLYCSNMDLGTVVTFVGW
jgi:hypothetical protein